MKKIFYSLLGSSLILILGILLVSKPYNGSETFFSKIVSLISLIAIYPGFFICGYFLKLNVVHGDYFYLVCIFNFLFYFLIIFLLLKLISFLTRR